MTAAPGARPRDRSRAGTGAPSDRRRRGRRRSRVHAHVQPQEGRPVRRGTFRGRSRRDGRAARPPAGPRRPRPEPPGRGRPHDLPRAQEARGNAAHPDRHADGARRGARQAARVRARRRRLRDEAVLDEGAPRPDRGAPAPHGVARVAGRRLRGRAPPDRPRASHRGGPRSGRCTSRRRSSTSSGS